MPQSSHAAAPGPFADMARQLDAQARSVGQRWVVVPLSGQAHALPVEGEPGALLIDPSSPALLDELVAAGAFAEGARGLVAQLGQQAAMQGAALREAGRLVESWRHQRVAALVAARLGSAPGVKATVANLAILRNAMREVMERGNVEAPPDEAGQHALREAAAALARDGALLAAMVPTAPGALGAGPHGLTLHRLACIAGNAALAREVRDRLRALGEPAAATLAVTAAEALAELDAESLLAEQSVMDEEGPTVRRMEPGASVWALYVAHRHRFIGTELLRDSIGALRAALSQLEFLRLGCTTAGGAIGHQMSYGVARLLQPVGRDLAQLLLRDGRPEAALDVVESLFARAMGDWMGRTHAIRFVPRAFGHPMVKLGGSLNAGDRATLDEVRACAAAAGPLLYLAALPAGHQGWLLRRDGVLVSFALPNMADALEASRGLFPSLAGRGAGSQDTEVRQLGSGSSRKATRRARDKLLTQLHDALWQPELRDALADQGEPLVIVADTAFGHVPWAALRSPQGRYLVQDHQIELWPSVTARRVIEAGARIPSWRRARRSGPVAPLAFGVSDFSHLEFTIDGHEVELAPLPGVATELARVGERVGARRRVGREATVERLLEEGPGAEILHLASHGLLDAKRAERSVLVLGDGILSAWQLYLHDRGLRCGLVVLSACQTALGQVHPDSLIGLANAFLTAGAQAVVATLWKVPDTDTMHLMEDFYTALSAEVGPAAALRQAQLAALATKDRSDPFCWAAPVVSGLGSGSFMPPAPPQRGEARDAPGMGSPSGVDTAGR